MSYVFSYDYGCTCMGCPIRMVGSLCGIGWDFYVVLFRKMGFGHQENACFLGVQECFYVIYELGQPVCISRRYVVYVNSLRTLVRRFMSVLIRSACLDKIISNLVKDSYIDLISVCSCMLSTVIVGLSVLFLVAWAYVVFSRRSVFCGATRLSFSCPGVYGI
jgi:hypothetical protein